MSRSMCKEVHLCDAFRVYTAQVEGTTISVLTTLEEGEAKDGTWFIKVKFSVDGVGEIDFDFGYGSKDIAKAEYKAYFPDDETVEYAINTFRQLFGIFKPKQEDTQ